MIDLRDDLVAALAGRYDIERELGHGGMAIVYLARDVRHGRHVAVKVLRPELATSLGAERFLREIDIAARLTHPNILALHDSGNAAGMLYFVMPYVEGESLRDRLEREHQLPLEDALSITRQVGVALDYAHDHGVVHRDIKPENILLVGDHVLVADFGLARALHTAGTNRLTESAVAVGTPAYMSPEQAAADPEVDGRTDLYSLACVLFEMIAGTPPFKGATGAALLAQHLTAKPPSICAQRPHCPAAVDAAVARALEKTPADRFRNAREFYAALTGAQPTVSPAQHTPAAVPAARRRHRWLVAGSFLVVAVAIGAAVAVAKGRRGNATASVVADRNSYVVLPLTAVDAAARADTAAVSRRIADALGEWDGVHVVGAREVDDQLAQTRRGGALRLDDAVEVASRLGAAKVVWGEISANSSDSAGARIARLTVYDVATGQAIRRATLRYAGDAPGNALLRVATSTLLRGRGELPWRDSASVEHPSLPAWLAYDAGREAISRWDLADATREFRTAVTIDPAHAQANLWLSLVEMWSGLPRDHWRPAAKRAHELRDHLDPRDTALAEAQLALAEARYPQACAAYRRFLPGDTTAVVGWFGLGECESRDSLVVRDAASPSSWRFRGSLNRAVAAYMRIVEERAPPQPTFVYTRLSQLLTTSGIQLRQGHSEGAGRQEFGAYPSLIGDTLVFTPYPLNARGGASDPLVRASKARALDRNRRLLRQLYQTWAANAPQTFEAQAALAGLLESLDEISGHSSDELSALSQIRKARRLAPGPDARLLLARTELRLLVKAGEWKAAADFADSVFAANPRPDADSASALAGAAALTGRIAVLSSILRTRGGAPTFALTMPNGIALPVPPALEQDAASMFAYALTGACVDSLRGYRQRVERQLASYIPEPTERAVARGVLLRRPLGVAMPCVGAASLLGIDAATDRMVRMEQAFATHDAAAFRATYDSLAAARALNRPGDAPLDYVYMESWMLAALGDTAAATAHLDQPLEALPTLGTFVMEYPAHSAALVRAMGLRAELAAAAGDRATAARWAKAVATLWAKADPELQPYVRKMCALAGTCGSDASRFSGR